MSLFSEEPTSPDNFVIEFGGDDQPPARKKEKDGKSPPVKRRRRVSRRTSKDTLHQSQRQSQASKKS